MTTHRWKLAARVTGAAAILALALPAMAQQATEARLEEMSVNTGYFGDVAIKGYDTVAYFTENAAVQGTPEFKTRWLGATWYFASAENRDAFVAEPVKYAPQYGGHCADGVSLGTITTNIDPKAWRIIEGKLYLNYDPGAADGFEKKPTKVTDSQKYWPQVEQGMLAEKREHAWQ